MVLADKKLMKNWTQNIFKNDNGTEYCYILKM